MSKLKIINTYHNHIYNFKSVLLVTQKDKKKRMGDVNMHTYTHTHTHTHTHWTINHVYTKANIKSQNNTHEPVSFLFLYR